MTRVHGERVGVSEFTWKYDPYSGLIKLATGGERSGEGIADATIGLVESLDALELAVYLSRRYDQTRDLQIIEASISEPKAEVEVAL